MNARSRKNPAHGAPNPVYQAVMRRLAVILPEIPVQDISYELAVIQACRAMFQTFDAVENALHFLRRAVSAHEISACLKLYIISWATLSDVLAIIINEVFRLGYPPEDIRLSAVLRNRRVAKSEIPAIVRGYSACLRVTEFSRMRNDVVHRGVLREPRVIASEAKAFGIALANLLGPGGIIHGERAMQSSHASTSAEAQRLASELYAEFNDHYSKSCELIFVTSSALAKVVRRTPRRRKMKCQSSSS